MVSREADQSIKGSISVIWQHARLTLVEPCLMYFGENAHIRSPTPQKAQATSQLVL